MQIPDIYNLQVLRYASNSLSFPHGAKSISNEKNESETEMISMWSLNVRLKRFLKVIFIGQYCAIWLCFDWTSGHSAFQSDQIRKLRQIVKERMKK